VSSNFPLSKNFVKIHYKWKGFLNAVSELFCLIFFGCFFRDFPLKSSLRETLVLSSGNNNWGKINLPVIILEADLRDY